MLLVLTVPRQAPSHRKERLSQTLRLIWVIEADHAYSTWLWRWRLGIIALTVEALGWWVVAAMIRRLYALEEGVE